MDSTTRSGFLYGIAAALMWALLIVYSRKAVLLGVPVWDVILLRYGIGALIMLPWLMRAGLRDLASVGWGRGAVLALCAGPLFLWFSVTGFHYAPLAHGAVIQPPSSVLVATLVALIFLGERLSLTQSLGLIAVLTGITLVGLSGADVGGSEAWRGQMRFFYAGALWALLTLCLRVWDVPGLAATAAVNVISAAVVVPLYLAFADASALRALPLQELVPLALVHGVLAGVLAIAAYGRAVSLLGISRAALFPAIVPAVVLVIGIPLLGEWPTTVEWVGAALATLGLSAALGVWSQKA